MINNKCANIIQITTEVLLFKLQCKLATPGVPEPPHAAGMGTCIYIQAIVYIVVNLKNQKIQITKKQKNFTPKKFGKEVWLEEESRILLGKNASFVTNFMENFTWIKFLYLILLSRILMHCLVYNAFNAGIRTCMRIRQLCIYYISYFNFCNYSDRKAPSNYEQNIE
eukprot:TRINITY_DN13051_c0_g1_i1.p3 TRINITY_DN13051_c0_g1~~TRINITY_DN13051_c0_g1_i1.p3  ORF type:complete len:167 (+),score=7.91 TRINITY_DN13051_c0_g1_i1:138-638(+)